MKKIKIIRNFIILSIPLVIMCIYSALCPIYYMSVEYSMWDEEKEFINASGLHNTESGSKNDLLILGDSRAKSGILPDMLSDNGYNAAIGGTTPIEMYYALDTYLEKHDAPDNIIVIFAPYHLCDIDNWEQTLYYNYLSLPQILEVYKNACVLGEEKVAYKWAWTDILSYKLRLPNKYLSAEYNANFVGRYGDNLKKKTSVIEDRGYTEFGTENGNSGLNYETHHEYFDYSDLVILYYEKLLEKLSESGSKVYIIQSPVNEASYPEISEDFFTGYAQMIGILTKDYDFVVETEVKAYPDKYFGDNNHLNRKGAQEFSRQIKDKYF